MGDLYIQFIETIPWSRGEHIGDVGLHSIYDGKSIWMGGWGNNNWISEFAAGSDGDTKVDLNFELGVVNERYILLDPDHLRLSPLSHVCGYVPESYSYFTSLITA
jgi:hypothetical protein